MARTLTVDDVANYILARLDRRSAEPITNMKLQKLVYLVQGTALAMLHRSLWDNAALGARVTAYEFGPVVPDLWRVYRDARRRTLPIPSEIDDDAYDGASKAIMDDVLAKYGHLSAEELANITHHHDPWVNTWDKAHTATSKPVGYDVIPEPDMEEFFTRLLAGPSDLRDMTPEQLSAATPSKTEWRDKDARAAAEIAAGKGMGLRELRRFLDL